MPNDRDAAIREDLSAYIDGELDAARRAEVERAVAESPELRAELDGLRLVSLGLHDMPREAAPRQLAEDLRLITRDQMRASSVRRKHWVYTFGRVGGIAAGIILCAIAVRMAATPSAVTGGRHIAPSVDAPLADDSRLAQKFEKTDVAAPKPSSELGHQAETLAKRDEVMSEAEGRKIASAKQPPAADGSLTALGYFGGTKSETESRQEGNTREPVAVMGGALPADSLEFVVAVPNEAALRAARATVQEWVETRAITSARDETKFGVPRADAADDAKDDAEKKEFDKRKAGRGGGAPTDQVAANERARESRGAARANEAEAVELELTLDSAAELYVALSRQAPTSLGASSDATLQFPSAIQMLMLQSQSGPGEITEAGKEQNTLAGSPQSTPPPAPPAAASREPRAGRGLSNAPANAVQRTPESRPADAPPGLVYTSAPAGFVDNVTTSTASQPSDARVRVRVIFRNLPPATQSAP